MSWLAEIEALQGSVIDEFGEPVTIYPASGAVGAVETRGIFDNEHIQMVFGETVDIVYSASGPLLGIRLSDYDAQKGDEVSVRGARYRVVDSRPDGQGMTVLVMEGSG